MHSEVIPVCPENERFSHSSHSSSWQANGHPDRVTLFKSECPILPHQCGYWGKGGIVEQKSTYCVFLASPFLKVLTDIGSFISLWSYFGTILLVAGGQCRQFLDAHFFRWLLRISTAFDVEYWQPCLQVYRKTSLSRPSGGSSECHSAVNADLGIQPVSFPYGALWRCCGWGERAPGTIHSALNDAACSLGWRSLLPSSTRASQWCLT